MLSPLGKNVLLPTESSLDIIEVQKDYSISHDAIIYHFRADKYVNSFMMSGMDMRDPLMVNVLLSKVQNVRDSFVQAGFNPQPAKDLLEKVLNL